MLYFRFRQLGVSKVADICPKAAGNQWGKSFYRPKEGATCRIAQSALIVIFKLVVGSLTRVILII